MAHLLLVEDDTTFSKLLSNFLGKHGHQVKVCSNIKEAREALKNSDSDEPFEVLMLDYRLPDGNSVDFLKALRSEGNRTAAFIMTSFHDVRTAVTAMQIGAFDYITKPVNPEELLMVLREALNKAESADTKAAPKTKTSAKGDKQSLEFIEGKSKISKQLYEYVRLVSPTDMSVIIQGESGTGKEHVAKSIHKMSKRSNGPFVAIDCGSLSKELAASELFGHKKGAFTGALQDKIGQFEAADGGTLFLDEIGNLGYDVQIKLLRALQERIIVPIGATQQIKVDVRLIAATNEDLMVNAANGDFRDDLYHRLNEFKIEVPPLRKRGEDLGIFIHHFVERANEELGRNVRELSKEVMDVFHKYDWPGNLRELNNVIKRLVLLSKEEVATLNALPAEMITAMEDQQKPAGSDLKALQETHEKEMIEKVLQEVRYNKSKAAKLLNIDRKTLYYKIEKYHIE
ncbi:sigma-54-dependent transcriptional regulator [Dyadobacter fanqingshengii]|uniref:Sigma-54 dependent transcriptional regulator n=1 Tax=Dyadobacter fanqingshengii TaxID=2906443 RepID=A0A9X1PCV2_9BACT|nr:sigma-54 dependent transcriptional regulator [Dyadobacter fanqingshengii]MCF0042886.1 sigma-54 dependent transcriptional regulator [Dyadobacter fanqingshengii]MCF2507001.1 sigma-54 dependent transcriptional regulator [Dyadobacter fanqingshengii]USJ35442.1 sigma-54 dependent transcriptional regulator [Dyadobacter fanqingshengii]